MITQEEKTNFNRLSTMIDLLDEYGDHKQFCDKIVDRNTGNCSCGWHSDKQTLEVAKEVRLKEIRKYL